MRSDEPLDVFHNDGEDCSAKLLHGLVPLLDDRLDEGLLNNERIITGEFAGARSDEQAISTSSANWVKRRAH